MDRITKTLLWTSIPLLLIINEYSSYKRLEYLNNENRRLWYRAFASEESYYKDIYINPFSGIMDTSWVFTPALVPDPIKDSINNNLKEKETTWKKCLISRAILPTLFDVEK